MRTLTTMGLTVAAGMEALFSVTNGDTYYTKLEAKLASLGAQRDVVASRMSSLLQNAEFGGVPLDASTVNTLVKKATKLLNAMHKLAGA